MSAAQPMPTGAGRADDIAGGPDVLVVGSASRDLTDADPRGWRLGGGVTYGALAAARLGLRTAALVGVDAEAAAATELDLLRGAGVDLVLERLAHAPVFVNRETPTGRVQTCVDPGRALQPRPVPPTWARAPIWFLAPVANETQDDWARAVPPGAGLALGWQGLLRTLAAGETVTRRRPVASPLVGRADLIALSRHDVADDVPEDALLAMLRPGAQLVVTHGSQGGRTIAVHVDGSARTPLAYAPAPSRAEIDPTGAGDTFLAALIVASLERSRGAGVPWSPHLTPADLAFAAAAAALVVEGPGLTAVPDRASVLERLPARPDRR
jgi:sugar/nucleoside kinase (ribokinase family)